MDEYCEKERERERESVCVCKKRGREREREQKSERERCMLFPSAHNKRIELDTCWISLVKTSVAMA